MRLLFRGLSPKSQFMLALLLSTVVGAGLLLYSSMLSHNYQYSYLLWNLFLAWIPIFFSLRLVRVLGHKPWSSWEALAMTLLWLLFLPNSFYMVSDFIHLQTAPPAQILYFAVTFTSIIYTAVVLGFISLYMVHRELRKRFSENESSFFVIATLLICCVAIYIGRDLRWNSWDVLTNPGGILFDLSNQLIHFSYYGQAFSTVAVFFVLLGSMYILAWKGLKLFRAN